MKTFMLLALATAHTVAVAGTSIVLEAFNNPKHDWRANNDPVMGGKSTSTTKIANNVLVFDGEVVDVPFLKAPGFITSRADDAIRYPDISSCDALVLRAKSSTADYAGFRLSFGRTHATGNGRFAYGFKSNFNATQAMSDIVLPLHGFSDDWNDATGVQTKTCAQNKIYCPNHKTLEDVATISFWGEGVAGKVHLEVASISASGCGSGPAPAGKNIVQLAEGDKDLSTLVTALTRGNLTGALSGKGPFTVFAPTNEAFAKLPADVLKHLLEPKNIKELDAVLEYHVIAGAAVHAADLKPEQKVKTLEGSDILIEVQQKNIYINREAKVTTADVDATNGVVHIIDTVLVPK